MPRKSNKRSTKGKTDLSVRLRNLKQDFSHAFQSRDYNTALRKSLAAVKLAPQNANALADVAVSYLYLERWSEAIKYGLKAAIYPNTPLSAFDALSHAYGASKDLDNVRTWGKRALEARARSMQETPRHSLDAVTLPPQPSPETREHNIIAFSLFGADPKYCETAILNVQEQPQIYPGWKCHFFVDDTVPRNIIQRLQDDGGIVTQVTQDQKDRYPGPMWRFLAYDTPQAHRFIFRDADSVISERESAAVEEWVNSGALFHMMRDAGTHTELMLAGLWGCVAGSLPEMAAAIDEFVSKPISSRHFADQFFLRQAVWPTAKESLIQHDSMFDFMEARPFPGGPQPDDFHVGYAEGSPIITIEHDAPDGAAVIWTLYRRSPEKLAICSYPGVCRNKAVVAHLPRRYVYKLQEKLLFIKCEPASEG